MNIVDGAVEADGARVRLGGADAPALAFDHILSDAAGRVLKVGLRPEHLVASPNGALALTIELVENLGADALLYGRVPGGASLVARADGGAPHKAGDTLRLDVAPRHVNLFDSATGRRIGN
jgi:sn-glycerol 3-phosphate transport system ATP-binding protein